MKNPHDILNVKKDASDQEIKKAYKIMAKKYHPDVNKDAGAEEKFKDIQWAYSVLTNKDQSHQGNGFSGFGGMHDIDEIMRQYSAFDFDFSQFNGRARRKNRIKVDVNLTLNEIYLGVTKNIQYSVKENCDSCKGSGALNGKFSKCGVCQGSGQVTKTSKNGPFSFISTTTPCHKCHGKGIEFANRCDRCHGAGVVSRIKDVGITIPPGVGVEYNDSMLINDGVNELILTIREIKHDTFERHGNNLISFLNITLKEAILGTSKKIKFFTGEMIDIKVPQSSNYGDNIIISGKGLSKSGNLIVIIKFEIPHLSDKQIKEIKKIL